MTVNAPEHRPEHGNSGMCHSCLQACSHDYAPCPFCAPCEHLVPLDAPESYPEVARFAKLMYEQLVENEHKGNRWLSVEPIELIHDITWHWAKLARAYATFKKAETLGISDTQAEVAMDDVREYAADVANIAMMLVDNLGLLPPDERENSF